MILSAAELFRAMEDHLGHGVAPVLTHCWDRRALAEGGTPGWTCRRSVPPRLDDLTDPPGGLITGSPLAGAPSAFHSANIRSRKLNLFAILQMGQHASVVIARAIATLVGRIVVSLRMPMLTMFDILQFAGVVGGAVFGYRFGAGIGGTVGGILGSTVGIAVGWIAGRLPFVVSFWWLRRSLKRASVANLRSRLEREYFISHLIIAELVTRGEPVESFRLTVEHQLASQSADVQRFGQTNAQLWFPELVGGPAAG
jgi:hypothetical protein